MTMTMDDHFERLIEQARRRSDVGELVSIEDLADELGRSVRTLRRWNTRPGAPERIKRGRRHLYRRADVERWFSRGGDTRKGAGTSHGDR